MRIIAIVALILALACATGLAQFTLLGEHGEDRITAFEVAQWGNTISHEVTAAMSGRLPRVYYAAAEAVAMRAVACEAGRGSGRLDDRSVESSEEGLGPRTSG